MWSGGWVCEGGDKIVMPETETRGTKGQTHNTSQQHSTQDNILGRGRSGIVGIGEHTGMVGVGKAKQSFRARVYTQSLSEGANLDFFCVELIWARGENTRRQEIVKVLQGGADQAQKHTSRNQPGRLRLPS